MKTVLSDRADLYVELVLPEGRGPDKHRRLAMRRILDPLELDELMIPDMPPPAVLSGATAGQLDLIRWSERRERARMMCDSIGQSIALALRRALLDNK